MAVGVAEQRRTLGWDFYVTIVVAAALLAGVAISRLPALPFAEKTTEQVGRTLLSLFLVALIFERALEVIVSTWRNPGATELENHLGDVKEQLGFVPKDTTLSANELAAKEKELLAKKTEAEHKLVAYRCDTKRFAMRVSFVLGLLVAAAGLRTVEPSLRLPASLPTLQLAALKMLDVLLTGGVIAGGSDGIHKFMQAFTDFAEATSKKAKSA